MKTFKKYSFGTKHTGRSILGLSILAFFVGAGGVLNAASLKLMMDIASRESSLTVLQGATFSIFAISFQAAAKSVQWILQEKTKNQIAQNAKKKLLKHLEHVHYLKLSKYHSGDLLTRLSDDVDICAGVLPHVFCNFLIGFVGCIVSLIYGFYLNWKLTILCMVLAPLAVLWSKIIVPLIQKYAAAVRERESEIRSFIQEEIAYIPVIKSFISYEQSGKRFEKKNAELAKARVAATIAGSILNGGATIVGYFSFIGAASYGAYLCLQGEITVGTVMGFLQLLNYIVWLFTELMPLLGSLQEGKVARRRIEELENIPREEEAVFAELDADKIRLQVQDMAFSYDGDGMLMKNVDLVLKGKQFIGIMGSSGCGKSTFIKILMMLYRQTRGRVFLTDGKNAVEGIAMRHYVSYVPQDHMLISGTVAENIAYGCESYDLKDVIAAARKAGIHDVIDSLPDKYNTRVEEKGGNFSFGQAQRIAIARAIFRDKPVLLLDEPTASLDTESKKIIMQTLKEESKKRLCIMVCHDQKENEAEFDGILRFENGEVRLEQV